MTKIISCVGAKGGTGKSSVTLLLAWELAKAQKKKVAVLDADVQGTCVSAGTLNKELPFQVFPAGSKKQLWEQGKQLNQEGYDYLIIDGNPRSIHEDPDLIKLIAKLSDINLIVSRPSPRDVKAQLKYVEAVKSETKGKTFLLWNFIQKNTGAHKEGIPEGETLLGLKSLKTTIGLRIVYQDIGYDEGYIGSLGNDKADKEIKTLANEIRRLIDGKN